MTPDEIIGEFDRHGRLSRRAVAALRELLRGPNPYDAITVAVDTGSFELADDIAGCLSSADAMVRWNAAAALFGRLRRTAYADRCLRMANGDPDALVRSISLMGLGELLPSVQDPHLRMEMARVIFGVFTDESAAPEDRSTAYDAILAAMDVLPLDRPPASEIVAEDSINRDLVERFCRKYLKEATKEGN